ncbi:PREDICTED: SS18-like protein 2, partial [Ficedula albicollis]
ARTGPGLGRDWAGRWRRPFRPAGGRAGRGGAGRRPAGRAVTRSVPQLLEENDQLIRCIVEYQSKGRATDCVQYQHILHRNLIYLATIADATPPSTQKPVD